MQIRHWDSCLTKSYLVWCQFKCPIKRFLWLCNRCKWKTKNITSSDSSHVQYSDLQCHPESCVLFKCLAFSWLWQIPPSCLAGFAPDQTSYFYFSSYFYYYHSRKWDPNLHRSEFVTSIFWIFVQIIFLYVCRVISYEFLLLLLC